MRLLALPLILTLSLVSSSAFAATLNVVGGQLLGASGVDVGGTLYNVDFHDGTCIALFNGCDEVSDFTFQTEESALLASQALLDQVFLDGVAGSFDSFHLLASVCFEEESDCTIITPYGFSEDGSEDYDADWEFSAYPVRSATGARNPYRPFHEYGPRESPLQAGSPWVQWFRRSEPDRQREFNYAEVEGLDDIDDYGWHGSDHDFEVGLDDEHWTERAGFAVWSPVPAPSTTLLLGLGLMGLAGKGRRRNRS